MKVLGFIWGSFLVVLAVFASIISYHTLDTATRKNVYYSVVPKWLQKQEPVKKFFRA